NDEMPWAHHRLGVALYQAGHLEESSARLRPAITQQPVFPDAHLNLARSLYDYGDLSGVVETCEKVIAAHGKEFPQAHHLLGRALYELGDLDSAVGALGSALAADPTIAEAHRD